MLQIFFNNVKNLKEKRITIFIYLVAVLKDEINLKIAKCETRNEVFVAIRNLRFIKITSFKLKNDK